MRHRLAMAVLATTALTATTSGCGTEERPGTPQPVPQQSAANTGTNGVDVPKVANPLDTAVFQATPCDAVTDAQLQNAGLEVRRKTPEATSPAGPQCTWNVGEAGSGGVAGTFYTTSGQGLKAFYVNFETGANKLLEPLEPIKGYPAVIFGLVDGRASGSCSVGVGVRDDLAYAVSVTATRGAHRENPCELAESFAKLAVDTFTKGS